MSKVIYVKKPSISYVIPRACKHCGKEILKTFRGEFCSNKCADDYEYYHNNVDIDLMKRNKYITRVR